MTGAHEAPRAPSTSLIDVVRARIAAGKPIRRTLAGGGRLHVDRPVPFLCVYRPPAHDDAGTADLVRTQASYLIASAAPDARAAIEPLVDAVVEALADACGACLLLEVWAGDDPAGPVRIHTASRDRLATTIDALATALREMTLPAARLDVEIVASGAEPPDTAPVIAADPARQGVLSIGLEVPPVYRSSRGQYPALVRALARDLAHALQRGFFEFTRVQTPARPEHFHMLGRRRVVRAVRASDAALAAIDASFDFLLAVTPVNTEAAWKQFCDSGYTDAPRFHYRMLEIDPDLGKRQLYDLPIERLEDPVLGLLLGDKRRELDRRLGMLDDRDTPRFLHGSLQLYPAVDDALLAEAEAILARFPAGRRHRTVGARCGAHTFAARARAELDGYRALAPGLAATVEVRDDIANLLVSNGNLLVPAHLDIAASRIDAMLQHEVGTHALTYANGAAQPLRVLATGLADYEGLQEGLAMFAEYVAGGLDADRLRLIAARVVAVRRLVEGAAFPAVVQELVERHAMTARTAFSIAVRVFRGGGLTKDAIYLRGLLALLAYLHGGQALEPLLVGKLSFDQVALVEELLHREVLRPPLLRPRWLDAAHAARRIARARAGVHPIDLVEGSP